MPLYPAVSAAVNRPGAEPDPHGLPSPRTEM